MEVRALRGEFAPGPAFGSDGVTGQRERLNSSGGRARSERIGGRMKRAAIGARAAPMPATFFSRRTARMMVARSSPNCSRQVSARTRAPAGLCAPSMMVRSSQRWKRAGHSIFARPRGNAFSGIRILPKRKAATARAALSRWCFPARLTVPYMYVSVTNSSGASQCDARARITFSAAASCLADTTGTRGLMIPAFSPAIASSVCPSHLS